MFFFLFFFCQIQQEVPNADYEARVPVVQFPVKVMKGKTIVQGLKAKDFSLRENQLDVKILHVEPVFLPRTIEVLVDLSSSNSNKLQQSVNLCKKLIENMENRDRIKISSFSKIYLEWSPFTSEKEVLLKSLSKLQERGSTALYDAISKALASLAGEQGPKALFIITDGHDFLSRISAVQLKAQIKSYGIPIFLLYSGSGPKQDANLLFAQYRFLQDLTSISEGLWFSASDGLNNSLQKAIKNLGFRYKVNYQPPEPDNIIIWRRRTLSLNKQKGYSLTYPSGYRLKGLFE